MGIRSDVIYYDNKEQSKWNKKESNEVRIKTPQGQ